jgi:signal peptidase I
MGFRTYFVQPFKIPTGSMQPTLYGINVGNNGKPGVMDWIPFRYVKFLATGKRRIEVKAKTDGYVSFAEDRRNRKKFLLISSTKPSPGGYVSRGVRHRYYDNMVTFVHPGDLVRKGQLLANGTVTAGDHIFVDKMRYNFSKPKRGQVVVFRTDEIRHPMIQSHDHYIKRLAGLPNEVISIDPPYLLVNGKKVVSPDAFVRLVTDKAYEGYALARSSIPPPKLMRLRDEIRLGPEEFLPLGDNTNASLDGRYFGGVPVKSLIGPAFAVYWPFGPRWGWVQ